MSFETNNLESDEKQTTEVVKKRAETQNIERIEKELNEMVPIFAHGLARRLAQKETSGRVRVSAMAGEDWGVAKSPENHTDIPNVIIYPKESLSGDLRLVNAKLRHEIGNLNYPIEPELNSLRSWCKKNNIVPELLTSLAQAVHEASVNYLEIKNSHSSNPENNFKALYQEEINTGQLANDIGKSAPYKQAVDLTLLYSLSQAGIISKDQYELALNKVNPEVREIFNKQTQSVINQSIKTASPQQKVSLIRDFIWPKLSKLAVSSGFAGSETDQQPNDNELAEEIKSEGKKDKAEESINNRPDNQLSELQDRLRDLMQKIKQKNDKAQNRPQAKLSQEKLSKKRQQELKDKLQQQLSAEEKNERKDIANELAKNLQEQLRNAQKELEKLQQDKSGQKPIPDPQKPSSMQEISQQANDLESQVNQEIADGPTDEQLQQLKEQLTQLEEVAKQLSETGELEEKLFEEDEEEIDYNIKEIGIDESQLSDDQKECLEKVRGFTKGTSRIYKKTLDLLFSNYQQRNPRFTEKLINNLKKHKYDLPDFSIYGNGEAENFFKEHDELGIDQYGNDFLLNFNLPRPLGKLWYKGGWGQKAQAVKPGEIEWGLFYRMCMPAIWNSVDAAVAKGLFLNRINQFGQHVPKEYYYLWQPMSVPADDQNKDSQGSSESSQDQNKEQGSQEQNDQQQEGGGDSENSDNGGQQEQNGEKQDGQGQGSGSEGESGGEGGESSSEDQQGVQAPGSQSKGSKSGQSSEAGEQSSGQENSDDQLGSQGGESGAEGGGGQGGAGQESAGGDMPSKEQMQELLSQMQDAIKQASTNQSNQGGGANQETLNQLSEQLEQLQQNLDSGNSSAGDVAQNLESVLQQLAEKMGQGGESDSFQHSDGIGTGGQFDEQGFNKSKVEASEKEFKVEDLKNQGNAGNENEGGGVTFAKPDQNLLEQLRNFESSVGSEFNRENKDGIFEQKIVNMPQVISDRDLTNIQQRQSSQISKLEEIKRQNQAKTEALYKEMSGLEGEALRLYMEYMEETKELTDNLTDFFIDKFSLDREFVYERNQTRGARLQRGFQRNIIGMKDGKIVINPKAFEKKRVPDLPQFVWSIVIDNTGSVGSMIEEEKKLAVSLVEVTKRLNIPFEIVIYTEGGYHFLKTFDQEAFGDDLKKIVLLQATIGNQQDTDLLNATYASQTRYADQFRRSNNFIFFLTDGLACSRDSLHDMVDKFRKETVITGVGLAKGAETIKKEFGKNALEVPDIRKLSDLFIRKIEDQIDQTFD